MKIKFERPSGPLMANDIRPGHVFTTSAMSGVWLMTRTPMIAVRFDSGEMHEFQGSEEVRHVSATLKWSYI